MKDFKKSVVQINEQLFTQYSKLVQEITQARKASRFSQDDCAEMIGVKRRTIIQFEKASEYNFEVLVAMSSKFGVTIDLFYECD